jgi:hypothetical protein
MIKRRDPKPCRCCGQPGYRAYRSTSFWASRGGWVWLCKVCDACRCSPLFEVNCKKDALR